MQCNTTVAVGFSLVCNVSLYIGSWFLSGMQCHSTVAVGFSLVCNVSFCSRSGFLSGMRCVILQLQNPLYSGSGFLSGMQCVNLQWQWVCLWYVMCHSTLAVGFSLACIVSLYSGSRFLSRCNVSLYSDSGFLSGVQYLTLQWQWVSLWYAMCHSTVALSFSLVCNVSLYSGSGFLSVMQCVTVQ